MKQNKLVDDFNAISFKFSEDLTEGGWIKSLQSKVSCKNKLIIWIWDLDRKAEIAMDVCLPSRG